MSVSSLILQTTPKRQSTLRLELENIHGVQVHALTKDGRMVITVDESDQSRYEGILAQIPKMNGVIKASLVYNDPDAAFSDEDD